MDKILEDQLLLTHERFYFVFWFCFIFIFRYSSSDKFLFLSPLLSFSI